MSGATRYVNRTNCPGCNATPQKCQRKWSTKFGDDPEAALEFFNSRRQHTNSHPNKYKAKKYLAPLSELPTTDTLICLKCFNEWEKLHKVEAHSVTTQKRPASDTFFLVNSANQGRKLRKHSSTELTTTIESVLSTDDERETESEVPIYRKVSIRHDKCIFGCPSAGKGSLTSVSKALSFNLFTKYKLFVPALICKICKSHQTTADCDLLPLVRQVVGKPMQMSKDALSVFSMFSGFVATSNETVETKAKKQTQSSSETTIGLSAVFRFTSAQYKHLIGFTSEQFKRLVLHVTEKQSGKQTEQLEIFS